MEGAGWQTLARRGHTADPETTGVRKTSRRRVIGDRLVNCARVTFDVEFRINRNPNVFRDRACGQ